MANIDVERVEWWLSHARQRSHLLAAEWRYLDLIDRFLLLLALGVGVGLPQR